MAEAKKKPTLKTPTGTAVYPWLDTPDTKYKAEGEYRTKLILPLEAARGLIEEIDRQAEEAVRAAKAAVVKTARNKKEEKALLERCKPAPAPYRLIEDDDGNETGEVELSFKTKALVKPKKGDPFRVKPAMFDARGNEIKPPLPLRGGSKIKVAFQIIPFYTAMVGAGVTLRLQAVQVIEAVTTGGGGSAASFGFEAEDGYEFDPNDVAAAVEDDEIPDETLPLEDGDGDF